VQKTCFIINAHSSVSRNLSLAIVNRSDELMNLIRVFRVFLILCTAFAGSCALLETEPPKKPAPTGLIATPPTYYSTAKARYLGTKYKDNLDRLVARIVRNPKTGNLQFANNISSVGGIGFFTHSAAKSPDERYLEVVLGTSETFETKGAHSEKVARLFSLYGTELLVMLSGDAEIYQDKELSGYGLNLAWRNVATGNTGGRVVMERAIVYFRKERVRSFLRQEFNQNELLSDAVIFAVEEDGPLQLLSYRPQEVRPDFRPAIREDNLAAAEIPPKPVPAPALKEPVQGAEEKIDKAKMDSPRIKESGPTPVTKPGAVEAPAKAEVPVVAEPTSVVDARKPATSPTELAAKAPPVPPLATEQLAAKESTDVVGKTTQPSVESRQEVRREPIQSSVPAPDAVVKKPASVEANSHEPIASAVVAPRTTALVEKAAETALPVPAAKMPEAAKSAPVPSKMKADPAIVTPKLESPPPAPKIAVEPPEKQSVEVRPLEDTVSPAQPVIEASAAKPVEVESPASSPPVVAKAENKPTVVKPAGEMAAPVSRAAAEVQPPMATLPTAAIKTPEPVTPARSPTRAAEVEPVIVAPKPAVAPKIAVEPQQTQPAVEAKARETVALPPALPADSPSKPKSAEVKPPVSAAKVPAKAEPNPSVVKPSVEIAAPVSELAKPKAKAPVATWPAPTVKIPEPGRLLEPASSMPLSSATEIEQAVVRIKPAAPAVAPTPRENTGDKTAGEQIALLKNKPIEALPESKPLVRPVPRSLEGFIVQLAFNDKEKAQRWAEGMEKRGYAVSITEAGMEGALRVRLGNFAQRDEAERQLRNFKQEGLTGIIINLPQGFRPGARSSIP
jgi:DedD protein